MTMPRDKVPATRTTPTIEEAVTEAASSALEQAASSEVVQRAYTALLLKAAAHAAHTLDHGSPERKDKMVTLLAAPAVRQTLAPRADDANLADMEEFHRLRREMIGATDE